MVDVAVDDAATGVITIDFAASDAADGDSEPPLLLATETAGAIASALDASMCVARPRVAFSDDDAWNAWHHVRAWDPYMLSRPGAMPSRPGAMPSWPVCHAVVCRRLSITFASQVSQSQSWAELI